MRQSGSGHPLRATPLSRGEVLLCATSASALPSGAKTGAWLPEIAVPYCTFVAGGYDVTIASPNGGQVPIDAVSTDFSQLPPKEQDLVKKFQACETAQQMMTQSVPLSKVETITKYNAIFMAGGHGASMDFPSCKPLQHLVKEALDKGVIVAALCHGNAVFASEELGKAMSGKQLAVFSDEEERQVGKESEVPFLLETRLKEMGAKVLTDPPMGERVTTDGLIATGGNPASSMMLAHTVMDMMQSYPEAPPTSPRSHHPGTFTAAEVPTVLGVAPILPAHGGQGGTTLAGQPPTAGTGAGGVLRQQAEDLNMDEDVVEPYMVNLGPEAQANPGSYADNDAPASA